MVSKCKWLVNYNSQCFFSLFLHNWNVYDLTVLALPFKYEY